VIPQSIAGLLAPVVSGDPTRHALVTRSGTYSYAQVDELADRARDALWALGVRPGDRVAVSLPNDTDVVATFHGAMRLGAIWVGVNRNLAAPEKIFILDDSAATVFICDADAAAQIRGRTDVRIVETPDAWCAVVCDAPAVDLAPVDPHAPAAIAYTSGTTGHPKGVVHSQYNLLLPGAALVASRGYDASLRKGDCFPMTIVNLQVLTTLLVFQAGGCCVLMDRIDAAGVAEWIRRERVSTWNGPPALLHSLVERDDITTDDLRSLDEVWTGGADCPESLRDSFEAKFGIPVLATYGLTEAPSVVTIDARDGDHRTGASGRPLPHLAVSVHGDDGARLPPGESGEVCIGPVADAPWADLYRPMLGYLGRAEATAVSLAGGLLHTGDIGFVDTDGFVHVRDRKNLLILRGGANVYPAEVERVLGAAPGVAGCAVFGVPDERLGERVAAIVEPLADQQIDVGAVTAYCLERLAKYKVPESITEVDAIPRNAMGKVSRSEVAVLGRASNSSAAEAHG
jgi:long-chain acyl-CoA synthetase